MAPKTSSNRSSEISVYSSESSSQHLPILRASQAHEEAVEAGKSIETGTSDKRQKTGIICLALLCLTATGITYMCLKDGQKSDEGCEEKHTPKVVKNTDLGRKMSMVSEVQPHVESVEVESEVEEVEKSLSSPSEEGQRGQEEQEEIPQVSEQNQDEEEKDEKDEGIEDEEKDEQEIEEKSEQEKQEDIESVKIAAGLSAVDKVADSVADVPEVPEANNGKLTYQQQRRKDKILSLRRSARKEAGAGCFLLCCNQFGWFGRGRLREHNCGDFKNTCWDGCVWYSLVVIFFVWLLLMFCACMRKLYADHLEDDGSDCFNCV